MMTTPTKSTIETVNHGAVAVDIGARMPELAEDDLSENEKDDRLILPPSAAVVSRHLAALEWPADYLRPDNIGSARMLGLWVVCRARRISFERTLKGRVARGHA